MPSASFNLIQQVGRLIRSHNCWGEVVIYDKRLLTKNYGARLLNALPVFSHRAAGRSGGYSKTESKTDSKTDGPQTSLTPARDATVGSHGVQQNYKRGGSR